MQRGCYTNKLLCIHFILVVSNNKRLRQIIQIQILYNRHTIVNYYFMCKRTGSVAQHTLLTVLLLKTITLL